MQKLWVDEFGGSVELGNACITTTLKDASLRIDTTISTDLFSQLPISNIIEMSSSVIISEDYFLFYGKDEYFRAFSNKKERVSPLSVGADNILQFLPYIKSKEKYFEDKYAIYSLPNEDIELMIRKNNG